MIVILGAFGRTGRVVARIAQWQAGERIRLVTRQKHTTDAPEVEVAVAELWDSEALARACAGARALFALLPDDFAAEAFHQDRQAMAEAVASAVRRERVRRVVLLSSSAAALGERGGNGLAADLAYFERLLVQTDATVTILRSCYFQDNVLQALPLARRDGVYPNFLSPNVSIPTVASADVAAVAAAELFRLPRAHSEIVDLLGPSYTPEQMASQLGAGLGRPLTVVNVPPHAQLDMLRAMMSPEAARAMAETFACLSSARVPREGQRTEVGQTRLEQTLRAAMATQTSADLEVA